MSNINIGEIISKIRKENNISMIDLAAKSKLTRQTINNIENGRKSPTMNTILAIAKGLDCTVIFNLIPRERE